MNPAVAERMRKVEALTRSPVAGEAAAARARLAEMRKKYGTPASSLHPKHPSRATVEEQSRQAATAARAARYGSSEAFEAWAEKMRRAVDHAKAQSCADRFNDQGVATVKVKGGWLHAPTGKLKLTDNELIARWDGYWASVAA